MKSLRRLKLFLFAAAIGTSGWYAWSSVPRSSSATTGDFEGLDGLLVDTPLVSEPSKIFAGGTVEGAQREIALRFEVEGRLKDVHVSAGDFVEKGSVLAELDADLWELKFAEAGTLLKLARAERDRLVKGNATVRREDLTIADAKVALAEGTVRRERLMLDKTLLRAPTDGIVLRVLAEPGELVGPGDNHELFTLVNRSSTRVRACVEELDAMNVAVGQTATVTADGKPDQQYAGIVQSCSPYVSPKIQRHLKPGEMVDVRVREVLIELADGGDLLIGLPVEVFIEPGPRESGSGKSPARQAPLRPTPQPGSPPTEPRQLGHKPQRSSNRIEAVESEPAGSSMSSGSPSSGPPTGRPQPALQRTAGVGEWRESPARD